MSLDLAEFGVLRLPPAQQFDAERNRPALRRATEGLLPDEVRLRSDKVTFDALRGQTIQSDYEVVNGLIGGRDARIRAYTRPEAVTQLLDRSPGRWGDF